MVSLLLLVSILTPAQCQDDGMMSQLLGVRRIHVEELSGGETAKQMRDMIIASLQRTGLFVLTEDPERADAFLRGSAEDLVYEETFQSSDSVDARGSISTSSSRPSASSASNRRGLYLTTGVGENESTRTEERRHEAAASVRLVNHDGDVIWATTQESKGGKFRGASADVAAKITRQLADDYSRVKREPKQGPPAGHGSALP